jgi:hypothetical protein
METRLTVNIATGQALNTTLLAMLNGGAPMKTSMNANMNRVASSHAAVQTESVQWKIAS